MITQVQKATLTKAVIQGTLWEYVSTYSGKFMVFVSTIILARLLLQEDFGVAGYALVFISFLEVVQGLGIGPALIYYELDEKRTTTAFWVGLAFGFVLLGVTWLSAPLAGWFFNDPRAIPVTRGLALTFPIFSLTLVHDALMRKEMAFSRKVLPEFARATSKGVVSIMLALLGWGAWSLIWGQLVGTAVYVVALWLAVPWWPRWRFHRQILGNLVTYGGNIVLVNVLGAIVTNLDYLMIGRFLGATALGVYTLGFRMPELLIKQFSNIIANVIFPAYTQIQSDPAALRHSFLQTIRYVTLITMPIGLTLALTARPFVLLFFSSKWAGAIPVLAIIAVYTVLRSLTFNAGDVYKAQGRLGVLTTLSLLKLVVLVPGLLWAVREPGTIVAVAWVQTAVALWDTLLNFAVASHLLTITPRQIITTLQPATVSSCLMILPILTILQLTADRPAVIQLATAVGGGILIYTTTLWWLHRSIVIHLSQTLQTAFIRR